MYTASPLALLSIMIIAIALIICSAYIVLVIKDKEEPFVLFPVILSVGICVIMVVYRNDSGLPISKNILAIHCQPFKTISIVEDESIKDGYAVLVKSADGKIFTVFLKEKPPQYFEIIEDTKEELIIHELPPPVEESVSSETSTDTKSDKNPQR